MSGSWTMESLFANNNLEHILLQICSNLRFNDIVNLPCCSKTMLRIFKENKNLRELIQVSIGYKNNKEDFLTKLIKMDNLTLFKIFFPIYGQKLMDPLMEYSYRQHLGFIDYLLTFHSSWEKIGGMLVNAIRNDFLDLVRRLYKCQEILRYQEKFKTEATRFKNARKFINFEDGTFVDPVKGETSVLLLTGENANMTEFLINEGASVKKALNEKESLFDQLNEMISLFSSKDMRKVEQPIGLLIYILRKIFNENVEDKETLRKAVMAVNSINCNAIGQEMLQLVENVLDRLNPTINLDENMEILESTKNHQISEHLLKFIDVGHQNSQGRTLLFRKNPFELLTKLVEMGADVNHEDINGQTPLMYLCEHCPGFLLIHYMVEKGANSNSVEKTSGNSILHFLAKSVGHSQKHRDIQWLIGYFVEMCNVDVNTRNVKGETPLFVYLIEPTVDEFRNVENVKAFIRCGARIDVQDNQGRSLRDHLGYQELLISVES